MNPTCSIDRAATAARPLEEATPVDFALLAGIFFCLSWGLGNYGLYEPHEGHFAGVGREMLLRGDWITPHLNGSPYLNKPPLLYWLVALSYSVFGITEFAARLPLALVGTAAAGIAWLWARELWGLRAARMASTMLAASAGWYLFCHQLLIDALLSTLLLANAHLFWKAAQEPQRRSRWVAFYGVMGLSMLAKGPIGPLFTALTVLIFSAARLRWELLRQCRPLMGVGIVLGLVLPWAVWLEMRNPGTLYYMIANENLKRAVDTRWPPDYSVVKVPPYIYVLIAMIWTAPWSLLLPQVCAFAKKKSRSGPLEEGTAATRDGVLILAIAALLPVVFFLPMSSRLVYYCLPTVPPFALLAAGWWAVSDGDCYQRGRRFAAGAFVFMGVVLGAASFLFGGPLKDVPLTASAKELPGYVATLMLSLSAMLLAGGVLLGLRRTVAAWAAMTLLIGGIGVCNISGFAALDNVWSSRRMARALNERVDNEVVWVSEGSKEIGASAGIAWYLGRAEDGQARSVYVMKDDTRRPPPAFPDPQPRYLMDRQQLNALWTSDTPALFVTDFLRTNWDQDAPQFPDGERHRVNTPQGGNRQVYANRAAWRKHEALRGE
jgi:4-amino-4-deoxy-L-arabinose transferase-like glycosyltransferase